MTFGLNKGYNLVSCGGGANVVTIQAACTKVNNLTYLEVTQKHVISRYSKHFTQ